MKSTAGLAATLIAIALPCTAAAPSTPLAISASYDVLWNGGRVAVMKETFEAKDGGYRIVSESQAVGLLAMFVREPLRMVSSGQLIASGLRPLHFESKRGDNDPRWARAAFDWQAGQLAITYRGRTETLTLPPATQDLLSSMYQFMFVATDQSQQLELSMTNGRKLDRYHYTVQPGVEIETPLGRMATLRLVRQHRPDESGAEVWLAPQHRYLPVKVLILDEDGSRYEQVITKLEVKSP